jgi:hypothetical protein
MHKLEEIQAKQIQEFDQMHSKSINDFEMMHKKSVEEYEKQISINRNELMLAGTEKNKILNDYS